MNMQKRREPVGHDPKFGEYEWRRKEVNSDIRQAIFEWKDKEDGHPS